MTFKADLDRFYRKTKLAVRDVVIETTKEGRNRLGLTTPILTGRASASWNASAGAPNPTQKPINYLNPGGAPFDGVVDLDTLVLGQSAYISNSIDYLSDLNAGSSRKAPAGFIEMVAVSLPDIAAIKAVEVRMRYGL